MAFRAKNKKVCEIPFNSTNKFHVRLFFSSSPLLIFPFGNFSLLFSSDSSTFLSLALAVSSPESFGSCMKDFVLFYLSFPDSSSERSLRQQNKDYSEITGDMTDQFCLSFFFSYKWLNILTMHHDVHLTVDRLPFMRQRMQMILDTCCV